MLTDQDITRVVRLALDEDAPWGDLTAAHFLDADAVATAALTAREAGVFAGAQLIAAVFAAVDDRICVTDLVADGTAFAPGEVLARVSGPARGIVTGERVALNLVQRMSGIATLTRRYVDAVAGTGVRVVDTRKTTPGLRALEKHAVVCGGGANHRRTLSDAVMVKDNHLALLAATGDVTGALRTAMAELPHTVHVEVEVDRLDQIDAVLAAGVDSIMLDNFSLADLRTGVAQIDGRALVEASGGVNLETIRAIAETGVDLISVGALTHSARALDLGLDLELDAANPDPAVAPSGDASLPSAPGSATSAIRVDAAGDGAAADAPGSGDDATVDRRGGVRDAD